MSSKANLGFVKAALRFAPALLRTPAWRLSVVFLTMVVAAIMTLIISVTSMKLSPDQQREYSLGGCRLHGKHAGRASPRL